MIKDFLSTISKEIINSGALKPTPSGEFYQINSDYNNIDMYALIGQILGIALNNRSCVDIKLMSSIWKIMYYYSNANLEDMEEYDFEIYESLKYIQENDVSNMDLTFTDDDDECVQVTNENKKEYIKSIIQEKLIGENENKMIAIRYGFETAVDARDFANLGWDTVRDFINGQEEIDLDDWKDNCLYDPEDENYVNSFFEIISHWSEENLKKLLKFITGSSVVPVDGFEYFDEIGGKIQFEFTNSSTRSYPISHTCYNKIDIPRYDNNHDFEEKLLTAIEVVDFALK